MAVALRHVLEAFMRVPILKPSRLVLYYAHS
jgi:hypothetical protein